MANKKDAKPGGGRLRRLFVAEGDFIGLQNKAAVIFVALSAILIILFVAALHADRRDQMTVSGLFQVEAFANEFAREVNWLRVNLPEIEDFSPPLRGFPDGLRRVSVQSWREMKAGEFLSGSIVDLERTLLKTPAGQELSSGAVGLVSFPHATQGVSFWSTPEGGVVFAGFVNGNNVYVVGLPPLWLSLGLTARSDNYFAVAAEDESAIRRLDNAGRHALAVAALPSDLIVDTVYPQLPPTPLLLFTGNTDVLGARFFSEVNIMGQGDKAPFFEPIGPYRLFQYREGFGAAQIPQSNLLVFLRWIPYGDFRDSFSRMGYAIALIVAMCLSLMVFVSAFSKRNNHPILLLAGELRKQAEEHKLQLLTFAPRNSALLEFLDSLNALLNRLVKVNQLAAIHDRSLIKIIDRTSRTLERYLPEGSPIFAGFSETGLRLVDSSSGRLLPISWRARTTPVIPHDPDLPYAYWAKDADEQHLVFLLILAHPIVRRIFAVEAAAWMRRFETILASNRVSDGFADLINAVRAEFPPGSETPFAAASLCVISASDGLVTWGGDGRWEYDQLNSGEVVLRVHGVSPLFRVQLAQRLKDREKASLVEGDGPIDVISLLPVRGGEAGG